ncbi:VOC family protein [Acinetobacter variabilis]|uniref:VOC family protein n=1 Tax=Acinetobacter TaxID=469 RepID=UPI00289CEB61|nr:VOC family protein [Acinetobacter variabilis]
MRLNHYLNFQGETEAAFTFYRSVFGGKFSSLTRYGDTPGQQGIDLSDEEKNLILHISLPINEYTELMGSDINDKLCTENTPAFSKGTNHYIAIILSASEQDEAKRLYEALSVNGQIEMPLEKTFWGALYSAFTDQFGVQWMINCLLEEHAP